MLFTSLGMTNWYEIIHNSGYWETGTKSPLLHMWLIAIEIQFYMIYPFYVYLVFNLNKVKNNFKERYIKISLLLVLLLVLGTFYYSYHLGFNTLYYSTFSRIASFLVGGIFSVLAAKYQGIKKNQLLSSLSYVTIILIICETVIFKLNDLSLFRGKLLIYTILLGL